MIKWLTIKAFLKKVWIYIKHYWYVPAVIAYTLALWFLFNRKETAFKILEARSESFEKQIKAVDDIHTEELAARDELAKKYTKTIELIEERYVKTKEELTEKKKQRVKEILGRHYRNSASMAFLLGREFGIEYIPPEEGEE